MVVHRPPYMVGAGASHHHSLARARALSLSLPLPLCLCLSLSLSVALCYRMYADVRHSDDSYNIPTTQAVDNRDAFAKAFYARLFGWIVTHCNQTLIDPEIASGSFLSLGILDIFGFEDFKHNSLEQLCTKELNINIPPAFVFESRGP